LLLQSPQRTAAKVSPPAGILLIGLSRNYPHKKEKLTRMATLLRIGIQALFEETIFKR